ncbi:MAG: SpoIIE family protein phosphatase [Candidatus Solibacter usitatus]|nr:SpoIIE family protein phosphatase [Candidatus Solibacter usitatus]
MAAPRKAAVRFRERSELLDFLLEVVAATSETLDLDRLLANVAEIVKRVVDCELLAILLYNERQQNLKIRYALGHRPEVVSHLTLSLADGITGAAAASREPVLVGDVRTDPRYIKAVDAVRTELAVPMIARNKLVGVLDVQSAQLHAYNEYDRALLRLVASRVAVAIDNARLYRRVDRTNRTLRTLAAISSEISSILDLDELLKKVSARVHELIHYDAFSILLVDAEKRVLKHRFSIRYDQRVEIDNIQLDKGITGAAASSREPVRVADTGSDPRYIASHPGIRSECAIPLVLQDKVIGVMDLECDKINFFTEEHVRTLSLLAPQIAISIENARLYQEVAVREQRMEQDLKAASELQQVMLPRRAPELKGLDIGIGLRPAREISGDMYDFFEHSEDHAVIAFGDVSGKGVAAALFGALVSGLLRTLAPRRRSPAVLLKSLNDALTGRRVDGRYVTLLVILWHPHSGEMSMSNAGALPPLVVRNGEVVKLRVEGVPAGLLDDREYEDTAFQTQPGDTIVLYSDGITDQVNVQGEEFGRGRLTKVVRHACGRTPEDLVAAIFAELDRFSEGAGRFDDQTLLVVKVQ